VGVGRSLNGLARAVMLMWVIVVKSENFGLHAQFGLLHLLSISTKLGWARKKQTPA
jgi:hypothetical protein